MYRGPQRRRKRQVFAVADVPARVAGVGRLPALLGRGPLDPKNPQDALLQATIRKNKETLRLAETVLDHAHRQANTSQQAVPAMEPPPIVIEHSIAHDPAFVERALTHKSPTA